jgi:hypothetical protein
MRCSRTWKKTVMEEAEHLVHMVERTRDPEQHRDSIEESHHKSHWHFRSRPCYSLKRLWEPFLIAVSKMYGVRNGRFCFLPFPSTLPQ